ncbi:MAG TPA: hypothetical protein VFN09_12935 [Rhodanobacteraceae bacterium]|nr:hypothetical protein [Rhodanobacteraceae bacterium]
MNPLTLTLNGLAEDDIADFRRVFGKLRSSLDADWRIVDDYDASLSVIDIDSIHGHMDWLRTVGSGQRAAVYTSAQYANESDLCLFKPLDRDNLAEILNAVSAEHGVAPGKRVNVAAVEAEAAPAPAVRPAVVEPAAKPRPVAAVAPVVEPVAAPAAAPLREVVAAKPVAPPAEARVVQLAEAPVVAAAQPEPAPAPAPVPVVVASLGDALRRGGIAAPLRVTVGEDSWVLDPEQETYHGPATLKPLKDAMQRPLDRFAAVDVVALAAARKTPSQPLSRLRWYAGLLAAPGQLHDGLAVDGRYMLARWPQIEREFPRHFRIATAMMKQPGTVQEIATASGAPEPDVADFINASEAVGIVVGAGDLVAGDAARAGGVMSRIRNPFGR